MSGYNGIVRNNIADVMFNTLSTNSDIWGSFIEIMKHPSYYSDFSDILVLLVESNVDEYLVTEYYKFMVYVPNHDIFPLLSHRNCMPNVNLLLMAIDESDHSYSEVIEDLFTLTGVHRYNNYLSIRLIEKSTTVVDVDNYKDVYNDSPEWIVKLMTYGRITPEALTLFIKKSISNLPDYFFHRALICIYSSVSITTELREKYDSVIMDGNRRKTLLGLNNEVSRDDQFNK